MRISRTAWQPAKVAVCFPGQGFQKLGMLSQFHRKFPSIVEPILEELDSSLEVKMSQALIDETPGKLIDNDSVNFTSNAQPLLLTAGYSIFRILNELYPEDPGHRYGYFVGHSLGEYTAWTAAGILPYSEAVRAVRRRGFAMESATKLFHRSTGIETAMTVLLTTHNTSVIPEGLVDLLQKQSHVDIGNINSPSQIVLSGDKQEIAKVVADFSSLANTRVKTRQLPVSGPFHSRIMAPAESDMAEVLHDLDKHLLWPPQVPVLSNLSAAPFKDLDEVRNSVIKTLTGSVRWSECLQHAVDDGCSVLISLGPGRIGRHMEKLLSPSASTVYVDSVESLSDNPYL